MINKISRRDFLKLTGIGLGALAFNPFKPERSPLPLPQFPAAERLGRIFSKVDIRSEPHFSAPSVGTLYDDEIVVWEQEVVTRGTLDPNIINQRWVKTPAGYIYAPSMQPVRNLPNTPLTAILSPIAASVRTFSMSGLCSSAFRAKVSPPEVSAP